MISRTIADARPARSLPPVSAAWLERVALHYLDRYSASTEMLRRTLRRRVDKRCRAREEDPGAHVALIEDTVARALRAGLVDDARFTAARLATLRRRGVSTRGAGAKLAAKGVARETVEAALEGERNEADGDAEIDAVAAQTYARRRRLGPYRRPDAREAHRERDLAAMARAGFAYGIAKAVIDAEGDAAAGPDA